MSGDVCGDGSIEAAEIEAGILRRGKTGQNHSLDDRRRVGVEQRGAQAAEPGEDEHPNLEQLGQQFGRAREREREGAGRGALGGRAALDQGVRQRRAHQAGRRGLQGGKEDGAPEQHQLGLEVQQLAPRPRRQGRDPHCQATPHRVPQPGHRAEESGPADRGTRRRRTRRAQRRRQAIPGALRGLRLQPPQQGVPDPRLRPERDQELRDREVQPDLGLLQREQPPLHLGRRELDEREQVLGGRLEEQQDRRLRLAEHEAQPLHDFRAAQVRVHGRRQRPQRLLLRLRDQEDPQMGRLEREPHRAQPDLAQEPRLVRHFQRRRKQGRVREKRLVEWQTQVRENRAEIRSRLERVRAEVFWGVCEGRKHFHFPGRRNERRTRVQLRVRHRRKRDQKVRYQVQAL